MIKSLPILCAATLLLIPLASCGSAPSSSSKTVEGAWEVAETTSLSQLAIAGGGSVTAPEGYQLTMTVDGKETGITTGTYEGAIVLTVTGT